MVPSPILIAVEPAPADDSGIEMTLVVEEAIGFGREPRMLEEALVACGGERLPLIPPKGGGRVFATGVQISPPSGELEGASQPLASRLEVLVQYVHDEIDGAAMGATDEAVVDILGPIVGERWYTVVMKRTERLMTADMDGESLGDLLDGEIAKTSDV